MRDDGWRRLVLMRHAKSDWSTMGQPDHERPLNERGRLAAPLMGAWIAEQGLRVDLALLSSAVRVQETWARLSPLLTEKPVVWTERDLYHADADDLLRLLRKTPEDVETVLMIGHNPGLEDFADNLIGPRAKDPPDAYPTAAVGVYRLEAEDWRRADYGFFALEAYAKPKSLV